MYAVAMRILWIFFLGLLLSGCRTASEDSEALASVVLRGNTPGQIWKVVEEVFARHGYKRSEEETLTMVYEKKASVGNNLLYGNWDSALWIRVKARLASIEPTVFRLECDGYRVRGRGERIEEEMPYSRMNKGHFQEILDEVAAKLGNPAEDSAKKAGKS
jgi:hypothetical protein